jgi:hypothetical protein
MHLLTGFVATLSVTSIYYLWRTYDLVLHERQRRLRQRVAFMLWVMATAD